MHGTTLITHLGFVFRNEEKLVAELVYSSISRVVSTSMLQKKDLNY